MDQRRSKLQSEDWLIAGMRVLAADGHAALKLRRLAAETGATTGSFYWHFEDIGAYRNALLRYWVEAYLPDLIERARRSAPRNGQLDTLTALIREEKGYLYDATVRDWANSSEAARRALNDADDVRRRAVVDAANADGNPFTDEELELLGIAWRGSADMTDTDRRFQLLSMIRRPTRS